MIITAKEAKHNVQQFIKNYGTSNLEEILNRIQYSSEHGKTKIVVSYINKKDYYLLKQNGFTIRFSATYEKRKENKWCTYAKTREISLQEYFCDNTLEDKNVEISWE